MTNNVNRILEQMNELGVQQKVLMLEILEQLRDLKASQKYEIDTKDLLSALKEENSRSNSLRLCSLFNELGAFHFEIENSTSSKKSYPLLESWYFSKDIEQVYFSVNETIFTELLNITGNLNKEGGNQFDSIKNKRIVVN